MLGLLGGDEMDLQLSGQTVILIGGASGIGHAIAQAFATERANVAILDISQEVTKVAEQLSATCAIQTHAEVIDVTDYQGVQNAASRIHETFGRIDHVIHAAAIGSGKFGFPFWNLEPSDWHRVLQVNLIGAVNVAHAFAPFLATAKSGSMLFLASVAGQMGSQTDPPYSASKAAVINFVQCAAKDLASFGVRVNALSPGMVATPLNQSVWDAWNRQQPKEKQQSYNDWAAEKIQQLVPLGRWQQPEDIASMAVFLASKHAENITGQTLNVDGGYVMHS